MAYSASRYTLNIPAVYTNPSAPGYILANGNVGSNLQTLGDTYFSDDAGLTWAQVRAGFSQFHMLDSAGILILGPQKQTILCSSIEYECVYGEDVLMQCPLTNRHMTRALPPHTHTNTPSLAQVFY